jgi:hypothetical protein
MDPNPVGDELCYVGYITDIISARYEHLVDINMCRVQWYRPVVEENIVMGIKSTQHNAIRPRDESGFKVVNTGALMPTYEEPFIMVDQVAQAIIVPIEGDRDWCLVLPVESKLSYVVDLVNTQAKKGLEI